MGLFGNIFGKKEAQLDPIELSRIGVDMHSHLIPGIDDGSNSMDESIVMLAKFESLGYRKVITTPHIMSDYFKNTPEIILKGLDQVRETASKMNLSIEIEAAAEYYYDDSLMNRLKSKEELLTFGNKHILFEFSFHSEPGQIEELFFEMLTQGYLPVLAHAERYAFLFERLDKISDWREKGINIQMNLNSLSGHYGPIVQKQAENMVDRKLVDFAGTDCHRIDHLMLLEESLSKPYFHKLLELDLKNPTL